MLESGKLSTEEKSLAPPMLSARTTSNDMIPKAQGPVSKAGYLFERRSGRMLQSWTRRYFTIDGEDLIATTRNPKVWYISIQHYNQTYRNSDSRNSDGEGRRSANINQPSRVQYSHC
jgi:hypothetical protein